MKIIFDARVLTHKTYTGVENYAKSIIEKLNDIFNINILEPRTINKYLSHLWTHFILPLKKGDILFCPANIAPIFVPKNKKLVLTIHDVAFKTYPNSFSKFFRVYYQFMVPINIKRADAIITVSDSSRKEISKYYPYSIGKIIPIHLGIDKQFRVLNIKKKKQILYVGSMNQRKNFLSVLKAFQLLNKDDYKLLMIGNFSENFAIDEENVNILKESKRNLNIEFKSGITNEELVKLYNESEVFVFPSFYEGFGLPILESMACGTPVICSNLTSMPEVGGGAVFYCDPYNVEDIKNKISFLLENEAIRMDLIQKGLARVKEFTWKKTTQKHIEVFEKVLKS